MLFILDASSPHQAIQTASQVTQSCQKHNVYTLSGLSFNPNEVKVRKNALFQLSQFFHDKKRLVIWHDE